MTTPYKIVKAANRPPELWIVGELGSWNDRENASAKEILAELARIGDVPAIVVHISSLGGSLTGAMAIHDALRSHGARITVQIEGVIASSATIIAAAGDVVTMPENGLFVIHAPWLAQGGNAAELRRQAKNLDAFAEQMARIYSAKSGRPVKFFRDLLADGEDHILDAAQALKLGLVDEIVGAVKIAAALFEHPLLQGYTPMTENIIETTTPSRSERRSARQAVEAERDRVQAVASWQRRIRDEYGAKSPAFARDAENLAEDVLADGRSEDVLRRWEAENLPATARPHPITRPEPRAGWIEGGYSAAGDFELMPVSEKQLRAFGSNRHEASERAYVAGQWIRAKLLRDPKAQRWLDAYRPQASMGGGVSTTGGVLVPTELSSAVISLLDEYGVCRQLARVVPMGSDYLTIPRRTGGPTAYWVGENSEITASDASFDEIGLSPKKLAILTRISSELAEDSVVDLAGFLAQEAAYSFAKMEDECFLQGDGTSAYGGMVGILETLIDGNHAAGAVDVATATHDTFAEIDATDLSTLIAALPSYARRRARWLCSPEALSLVFERLAHTAGGVLLREATGSAVLRYYGHDIVISDAMPTSTGSLDEQVMLLFGDFSLSTTMAVRRDLRMVEDTSRYLEYDQTAIRVVQRFDINNHDLGDAAEAGPVVGLVGSAS